MNEEMFRLGLALLVVGGFMVCLGLLVYYLAPPVGEPPYGMTGNMGAFTAGMGIVLAAIGVAFLVISLKANVLRMDLTLVPEAFEITRTTLVFTVLIVSIVSATLLTVFGRLSSEQYMQILMFILGNLVGGVIAYYAAKGLR